MPKNKIFNKRGSDNPLLAVHLCIVVKVTNVVQVVLEVSMSTHSYNEKGVVSLSEQPSDSATQHDMEFTSKVTFSWHVLVNVQPLSSNTWRVQMTIEAEGTSIRNFVSNPVDVALNTQAFAEFPSPTIPPASDNFWADRLEAGPYNREGKGGQHHAALPTVQFRLLPDSTGTKPERLLIEQTSMSILWIIGARNIVLIEVDTISA